MQVIFVRCHNIMTEVYYIENIVHHPIRFRPYISSDIRKSPVPAAFQKWTLVYP